jgi:FAD/FMN-containing dehydrogenase
VAGVLGAIDRRGFLASAGALVAAGATGHRRPLASTAPRTLGKAIRGHVFNRGAPGFAAAAHVYNERFDSVLPDAVARPLDASDVRAAVRWAVARGVRVRARSGGHSYAGYSTLRDGVVLDLRLLKGISVDRRARTATVGAGAQLIDVYSGLAAHGVTIPAGSCPSVGIAGVALGGGMGLAGRAFGLTADQIVAVEIVTADGALRTVDARTDPDLLWALRGGGGGNFGVVTRFTFRTHPLPASAAYFFASFPWSSAGEALSAWLAWAPHADQRLTSIFHLSAGGGATTAGVSGQFLGPEGAMDRLLGPLRAVRGASISTGAQPYLGLQLRWAGCSGRSEAACHTVGAAPGGTLPRAAFDAKSDYLTRPLPAAALRTLTAAVAARASAPGSGGLLFDSYGGAINRVAPSATAFVHRDALCAIQYLSYGGSYRWLEDTWRSMRPHVSGQAYQNYIDPALPHWQHAYYGANYPRLERLRRAVDPSHFFDFPQAIG